MSKPIGPGDKCIVIRSPNVSNVMKVVIVEEIVPAGTMPGTPPPDLFHWQLPAVDSAVVRAFGSMIEVGTGGRKAPIGMCPVANLKRLDDDDDSTSGSEDKVLEREAA